MQYNIIKNIQHPGRALRPFKWLSIFVVALLFTFELSAQQLAFPGAEGFGKYTTGGRGGEVYAVTNLSDSGLGSFRDAVNKQGPRIIIFRVSGTIVLETDVKIRNNDISIFGQTAPGDGIAISGRSVVIDADNVIIQHMRFRPGDISDQDADGLDALWGRENSDIMLSNLSMSWSVDETGSFYDNENFTLQWSILSESMYRSLHGKGSHGYGGIWGGHGATFHHNLLAHHTSRNPRFNGSRYSGRPDLELVDHRNNVIYNWGGNSAYAAEGGRYNIVNNYYKPGPATSSNEDRIIQPWPDNGSNSQPAGTHGVFYINGNYVAGSETVTNDNWQGVDMSSSFSDYGITIGDLHAAEPFEVEDIESFESADSAFVSVLAKAGATLPRRDTVDSRIVREVAEGTATYGGSYGEGTGIIDSQNDVGGWPELLSAAAPEDSDADGIPDEWEVDNGLNPENPDDGKEINSSGYSNLESYVHSINSSEGEFTPVPGELSLVTPVGETDVSVTPTFVWNPAQFAEGYQLQVKDGTGDGATVFVDSVVTDTTFSLSAENALKGDATFFWRVRALNESGAGTWTSYRFFVTEMTTSSENEGIVPNQFALDQNYPNPFNPQTVIRYSVPHTAYVEISVYDITGREVKKLVSENRSAGNYSVQFDASSLSSGVYLYSIKGVSLNGAGSEVFTQTRKMTLIK